jgi:hypothetical protein
VSGKRTSAPFAGESFPHLARRTYQIWGTRPGPFDPGWRAGFIGSFRGWVGNHPAAVQNFFIGLQAVTALSALADDGLSLGALPEEEALESASLEAGEAAADANKLNHIFGNPEYHLESLVQALGGEVEAYQAIQTTTSERTQGIAGNFEVTVSVGGQNVTVRGIVIDGAARIGTAFIP